MVTHGGQQQPNTSRGIDRCWRASSVDETRSEPSTHIPYPAGIIRYPLEAVESHWRQNIKTPHKHGGFHPKSSTQRLYERCEEGGWGLVSIQSTIQDKARNRHQEDVPPGWIAERVPQAAASRGWWGRRGSIVEELAPPWDVPPADTGGGWHHTRAALSTRAREAGVYHSREDCPWDELDELEVPKSRWEAPQKVRVVSWMFLSLLGFCC